MSVGIYKVGNDCDFIKIDVVRIIVVLNILDCFFGDCKMNVFDGSIVW